MSGDCCERDRAPNDRSRWFVFGASVRGASHERSGLPNQDAISFPQADDDPLILAVADGHGSDTSFRSDVGARLAVDVAHKQLACFISGGRDSSLGPPGMSDWLKWDLPRRLVLQWRDQVAKDLEDNPLLEHELDRLVERVGEARRQLVRKDPHLAYGSTLLAVCVTERTFYCCQIGDGDLLVLDAGGTVSRPLAGDDRLIANETTSLSGREAWCEFRGRCIPARKDDDDKNAPILLLLATDGVGNSFRDDDCFFGLATELAEMIGRELDRRIRRELEQWLGDYTRLGSGDDVTLALLGDRAALRDWVATRPVTEYSAAQVRDHVAGVGVGDSAGHVPVADVDAHADGGGPGLPRGRTEDGGEAPGADLPSGQDEVEQSLADASSDGDGDESKEIESASGGEVEVDE